MIKNYYECKCGWKVITARKFSNCKKCNKELLVPKDYDIKFQKVKKLLLKAGVKKPRYFETVALPGLADFLNITHNELLELNEFEPDRLDLIIEEIKNDYITRECTLY